MFKKTTLRRVSFALVIAVFFQTIAVYAKSGDIGYFGGITEGRRLPKTTEILLESTKVTDKTEFIYKEMIFLTGRPIEFEGIMSVRYSGGVTDSADKGTYTVTYTVNSSDTTNPDMTLNRNIVFDVSWRREGRQIIKDYDVRNWSEIITPGPQLGLESLDENLTYTLDRRQSYFNISIIEDHTAAVSYYRGDISQRAVYTTSENDQTVNEVYGSFYGYDCAWSSTEVHRLDGTIYRKSRPGRGRDYQDIWQMQYQTRPAVSVNKTLQYTENEPTLISFEGNYKEVLSNESGLVYDLFVVPNALFDEPKTGGSSIPSVNVFEQLIAPDLTHLKGHPAESDIKKLFAMQVLDGEPLYYVPSQAITRAQYTAAVVKALKLPLVKPPQSGRSLRNNTPVVMLFPDVPQTDPYFDCITTAYRAGIAFGRSNGKFYSDSPLEMQEALVILLRALGLENLGLNPTPVSLFTDDDQIANWARRELYAAERIGLISQDEDGKINPTRIVTKAEAAALINMLTEYMRDDLVRDYTDHIVNIVF